MNGTGGGSFEDNVFNDIYDGAIDPDDVHAEVEGLQPLPPRSGREYKSPDQPSWRQRVSEDFVKRRQTPSANTTNIKRLNKKMSAVVPIRLPKLPSRRDNAQEDQPFDEEAKEMHASQQMKATKPRAGRPRKAGASVNAEGSDTNQPSITYSVEPPSAETLYQITANELDKLPIELFDNDEADRAPEEWVQLGIDKYNGEGTPARSLFFTNREWKWTPCRVLAYDADTQEFTIIFNGSNKQKRVKRLSLLFDDESEQRFRERVESCRVLRAENLAIRRYTQYVDSQPAMMFSPIQQKALHGIVSKLMRNVHDLVMSRTNTVEGLLIEVRDEYSRSMKQAIIDYKRRDPEEEAKMANLSLPPPPVTPKVPYLAVVPTPPKEVSIKKMISTVEEKHFTVHPESTQVILALFKSWEAVKPGRFLATEELPIPMTLYEYQDQQDTHFSNVRDQLVNDWRSLIVNLIRDNLTNVFQLFVNDQEEYNNSELKRFLKMVTFMLRDQLAEMVSESIHHFVTYFERYADPVAPKETSAKNQTDGDTNDFSVLDGYLGEPRLQTEVDPNRPSTTFVLPIFVFKMSTLNGQVIFLPPLDSIEVSIMTMLSIPGKIQNLCQIDNEVVPLLGIGEVPLCTSQSVPKIFQQTEQAKKRCKEIINDNFIQPKALAALYQQYGHLLEVNAEEYVNEWFYPTPKRKEVEKVQTEEEEEDQWGDDVMAKPEEEVEEVVHHSVQETRDEIQKFMTYVEDIQNLSPSEVVFRMIKIDCHMVKEQLTAKSREIAQKLMEGLAKQVNEHSNSISKEFEEMLTFIKTRSTNVEQLAELKTRSVEIENKEVPRLQGEIRAMQETLGVLDSFEYSITREDFNLSWSVVRYPQSVIEAMEETKMQIEFDNARFQKELQAEQTQFQANLEDFAKEVETFRDFGVGTTAQMEQNAAKVELLQEKLDKADELVKSFNQRDVLFGDIPTEYTELAELRAQFTPYFQLWSTTSLFNASYSLWMTGPFMELDATNIEKDVSAWYKLMFKLEKELQADEAVKPARVASEMKDKINAFKENVPIIQWLRSPGLRPRHWDQISHTLAPGRVTLTPDNDLTLSHILALDVDKHKEAIEDISSAAEKEYALEQSLDKMLKEWKAMDLTLEEYKATNTYIMKGSDDILTLLDDQIMKTQAMRGSPYIKPFEVQTKKWEAKLQLLSQIMEEWLTCQKTWIYLEPIFSSEDIMRQMPIEGRRFGVVDAYWRKTMEAATRTPNILDFVSETDNLLKTFQESNKMLDLIGKGLNEYLETKRLAFPRFYFLSNDELLSILSQTKNATAVQPHLGKCFDAVHRLQFTDEKQIITGMSSNEGEFVAFHEHVNPNEGAKKGNVEIWLKDVEQVIFAVIKRLTRKAIGDYANSAREDWILAQPGQVVLSVSQLFFTREVTAALAKGGSKGLEEYTKQMAQQMEKLVELVRGDLTALNRLTLGALTVMDVHARDVVLNLVKEGVSDPTEFEWLAQLRYYWEEDPSNPSQKPGLGATGLENDVPTGVQPDKNGFIVPDGIMKVRMVMSELLYGYEYLGNSGRLVITPLTDRCYRTLIGAVHLNLGGAPEGPAGTGKTETVKDLAKAVAIQCIVQNGSDGLNYRSMAKFFKGLASSGSWVCFDEFNRIPLEVLSVVAQQVSSIQRAINEDKHTFFFDNINIPLIHTCSIFITMNPGYAGRAELPDNLKVLFRTVAMMIPDYAMIAEITLYSMGYSAATDLARKTVACLRLSSEQLSSQDHYDFGMRNLNSILVAAGALRRVEPDTPEDILCLRALRDCNVPKFVAADIPLFLGIVQDLFPTTVVEEKHNEVLVAALTEQCKKTNLQPTPSFIHKCLQLYDTFIVRHGLMVVGHAFAGKSSCIRTLGESLKALKDTANEGADVKYLTVNPKSVSLDQLYGADDPATNEWHDGVLPVVFREAVDMPLDTWKWVWFDGPVDALWIENMNTVLDGNKKLCLASGEQIKLVNRMAMLFEVQDLAVASPATVSRCGMVYMEPGELGWEPILASWLDTLPEQLTENRDNLKTLFDWVIPPCLFFLRKQTTSVIPTSEIGMVKNLTNIFSCLIRRLLSEKGKDSKGTSSEMGVMLECIFMFSLVWSLGVQTDTEGRKKFSQFAQSILTGEAPEGAMIPKEYADMKVRQPFPLSDKNGQYTYDFCLNMKLCKWEHWMETAPEFQVPDGARFNDIIVPTIDTVRTSWLLDLLILGRAHVLLVGNTGTGKSVGVSQKLLRDMPKTNYLSMSLTFSARTSVNQTQDIIDNKLERRRAGIFGPPPGRRSVIFVDDLNMPLLEEYGAQPPIELLRQWMDYGGWYERKTNQFKKIVDVQFLAAMGPPGGGRNPVTYRYLRHYNSICLVPYDDNSLKRIYTVVVGWWLDSFSGRVRLLKQSLVDATVDIYNTVTRELLPTPAKSHYTFNLRDISKVFQGVTLGQAEHIQEPNDLIRLWVHECSRVFKDRLVNKEDLSWFEACIGSQVQKHFKTKIDDVTDVKRSLIYADFSDPRSVKKPYIEIDDVDALTRVVEGYLTDYNNIEKTQMNLVMFTAAIEHVSRINRIIRQPYGNALLIGVGGSGRQSLTRLASFIADYEVFQIEVNKNYGVTEWQEDLRDVLRKAGILNKPMVFLFTDSQIQNEGFIEDINNILNNGEVPNLFPPEEYMPIVEQCRADASKAGKAESNASVFSYFVERCKENIHMVLCFSPVGDSFRNRLRMFPSLVNCTTIDWFHPWPTDALKSVASRFFKDIDVDQKTKEGIIDVCVDMQERVIKTSESFYNSLRRYNYVTPTSYLELIKIFRNLFEAKRTEIFTGQQRYENGLQKLNETAVSVKKMQIQLEALQPQLIQSSKETEELIVTIEERSKQVAETKRVVSAEEAECNEQAAEAEKIKEECTEALAEAMPALNNAMKALKVVQKSQLDELRAMKVPTPGVLMTIEALCIMMGVAPVKVGQVGKKTDDYWTPAKAKLLKDTKFMDRLAEYDKDNIPEKVILRVRPFVKNPEFTPAKIAMASKAAEGFCKWVIAMEIYDRVSKQVGPKREALAAAETKLAAASEQLAEKKAQLKEVQDLLDELNEQFDGCNKKKQDLESQVKECSERLDRAEKLIGGLAGEKDRWFSKAQQLRQDYNNVVGNILVSSGVVAYLGVFTVTFRQSCITHWVNLLKEKDIPCAEEFRLHHILGDPVAIRNWGIQKLPNDDFSIDNAVILSKSIRWGLLIDPQEQANKWIKNMEDADDGQLKVVKQTDDQFIRILSTSVQMGIPILIENLGEYLDPSLEPLLLKLVFKQGNRMMIRVGSEPIEFNNDFRLYMTTKLQNPHYPPETSTKVTLINFMVTQEGLQDQMLGQVVSLEEPELELKRGELIVKNAENQRQLQEIEDKILKHLSEASGNILDDEDLINTLQKSKQASKLIEKRMAAAAQTQEEIAATRLEYRGVSQSVANLFFCISDLGGVDPMYQYSLTWFTNLFARAVKESEKSNDVHVRTNNIDKTFLSMLYANVCRSLFEKDKLLFSFLLCVRVLANRNEMDPVELRFLLTGTDGGVNLGSERENPCDEFDFGEGEGASTAGAGGKWLNDNSWKQVVSLSKLKAFKGFDDYFAENQRQWRAYYESSDPFSRQLPGPWDRSLDLFQKMLVLRCLRPDKLIGCVKTLVTEKMGKQYVTPPPFDMGACYADSSSSSPLIFVLSPGVDPSKEVFLLADQMHMNSPDKLFSISLGQGQGPFAENAIREAIDKGTWVLLQNCHLLASWLPTLQKIVDEINPQTTNPEFRLWLTSMPSEVFPVSILQNGVKMTNEPPKGLQANLAATYRNTKEEYFSGCHRPEYLKKMKFGLSFFHAIVRERRKFGAMGWNVRYEFTDSDLEISTKQLRMFLDLYDEVPFKALRYLVGQLNYGGRVTDEWDLRTIIHILDDYFNEQILTDDYHFDASGVYSALAEGSDLEDYHQYIANLPKEESSEVFGLHPNVNITTAIKESNDLFGTMLSLQPRVDSGEGGGGRDAVVQALAKDIESRLPAQFDIESASQKYPVRYEESMNTVLVQELQLFNKLLRVIKSTLHEVQRAIKGEVVMSSELELMTNSMYDGMVPQLWSRVAYPSLKPLSSWVNDLLARLEMFKTWLDNGAPGVYWMSGFFFTQSFLTGTLQNFARCYKIAIDEISFDFEVVSDIKPDHKSPPSDGCYIHGLYLEGARWDTSDGVLTEPFKRQLFSEMPVIWLKPRETNKIPTGRLLYPCPVYRTSQRFGVLSTTGRSTNYIIAINLRSLLEEKHWVKRGVALLTQLDD